MRVFSSATSLALAGRIESIGKFLQAALASCVLLYGRRFPPTRGLHGANLSCRTRSGYARSKGDLRAEAQGQTWQYAKSACASPGHAQEFPRLLRQRWALA